MYLGADANTFVKITRRKTVFCMNDITEVDRLARRSRIHGRCGVVVDTFQGHLDKAQVGQVDSN